MEGVIEIRDLALAFTRDGVRTSVLEHLDLSIRRGEFLALVGPSGVGKSTLLRVIADLAKPSSGGFTIAPRADGSPSKVAMVFQDARLLPWRRVIDNVAFGLERLGLSRAQRHSKADAMLDLVGLKAQRGRFPHELSGGQRQRVSLARALAVDPDVLLMDEPFSALDPITRTGLQDELVRIWRETGRTILFVTHDIDEATYLADRVVLLAGSPAQVAHERVIDIVRPRRRDDSALTTASRSIRQSLAGDMVSDGEAI